MSPIAIEPWAHGFATRIAAQTGWRASDIYWHLIMTCAYYNEESRETTEQLFARLIDMRIAGESFRDVVTRLMFLISDGGD